MSEKFPPDYEIGIEWIDDDGKRCKTVAPMPHKTGKRVARLVESNFIGSIGGMHYYAKIKVNSPWWSENGDKGGHAGYGGKNKPELRGIDLEAKRILRKRERDMGGELIGRIGQETYRFNTPKEAKEAAIKLFLERFAPGWVLCGDDMGDGDDYPVLAET